MQKTAYAMRMSDWSSDVCSSDLWYRPSASPARTIVAHVPMQPSPPPPVDPVSRGDRRHIMEWGFMTILGPILLAAVQIGRASCRERGGSKCSARWSRYYYKQNKKGYQ